MLLNTFKDKNYFMVALLCAVLAHAGLVFLKFKNYQTEPVSLNRSLSVQLQKIVEPLDNDKLALEKEPSAIIEPSEALEPLANIEPTQAELETKEETTISTISDTEQEQKISATIINSPEFKQWLKSETERHIKNNPDSLEDFAQSFEVPVLEQAPDIPKEVNSIGTGVYMTRFNGKVRCHLQAVMPYNDDWSGNINTSKDCSKPKNTFEFELN